MEPFVNTYYASILFADISGFTRLSASLSEEKLRLHIKYDMITNFLVRTMPIFSVCLISYFTAITSQKSFM